MAKRQQKLFDDANDPPLVRAADRVLELREERKSIDEELEIQEKNLIGLMQKAKKDKIRHGGYVIQLKLSEAKSKISLKKEKVTESNRKEEM
jgi:hypothetical protein